MGLYEDVMQQCGYGRHIKIEEYATSLIKDPEFTAALAEAVARTITGQHKRQGLNLNLSEEWNEWKCLQSRNHIDADLDGPHSNFIFWTHFEIFDQTAWLRDYADCRESGSETNASCSQPQNQNANVNKM